MADKLVTSFRFTEENNKKEGLNSVFTDFIICRLTESKNRVKNHPEPWTCPLNFANQHAAPRELTYCISYN